MSNKDHQSEFEALQTLLTRGVITQEQFDQLSASLPNNPLEVNVPPPPPPAELKTSRRRILIATTLAVLVLVGGLSLLIKQQRDNERRDREQIAQEVKKQQDEEYRAKRKLDQKACTDRLDLATAWSDYVGKLNKNNDASRASSLMQAKKWSLEKSDATSAFRRVLKQVDHPNVSSYRDSLLRQVNLIEDAYTMMGGASTWSGYNSLITGANLLGNDLNEFKEDTFDALIRACQGE
jgi:hypothetical protein